MIRAALLPFTLLLPALFLAALFPAAATAADRTVGVGSFERLRIEGPFRVEVAAGPPRIKLSGDREAIERVEVRADGLTLVVREGFRSSATDAWGARPALAEQPVLVTLSTPSLASTTVIGAAQVVIARSAARRVTLSISGPGTITLNAVQAEQLEAVVRGSGAMTLKGSAGNARLQTNGDGTIDAGALATDQLVVGLTGPGEIKAQARYGAQVVNTGLGHVTVTGHAKCTVQAVVAEAVTCGPRL